MDSPLFVTLGVIGSGKSRFADRLVDKGYVEVKMASPIRDMLWEVIGWAPSTEEEFELFKTKEFFFGTNPTTGRKLLQNIGTCLRNEDADYWCSRWSSRVSNIMANGGCVVCSDARYPNEVLHAKELGAVFVWKDYHSPRYDCENSHPTERMAQYILKKYSLSDGEIIPNYILDDVLNNAEEIYD